MTSRTRGKAGPCPDPRWRLLAAHGPRSGTTRLEDPPPRVPTRRPARPTDRSRRPDHGRRAQPDRGQGQRTTRRQRAVRGRHRRGVRALRRRPGRPLAVRPVRRDAALARRPPGPVAGDHRSDQRAATGRPDDWHGRDPPPPRPRARPRHAHHDPRAPGGLPLHRRPERVLRAARVRRRGPRPPRALPPRGLRLDARRTRAGPGLRRPDGHGDRRRPAGRFAPDPRRSAHVDRRAHRQAQPAPRPGGDRVGDRRGGQATLGPRHDPRLSRRSRDRDVRATRVRGDVPRGHEPGAREPARPDRQGPHGLGRGARSPRPARRRRAGSARMGRRDHRRA